MSDLSTLEQALTRLNEAKTDAIEMKNLRRENEVLKRRLHGADRETVQLYAEIERLKAALHGQYVEAVDRKRRAKRAYAARVSA